MSDTIFLDKLPWCPPTEDASEPGWIKHVRCAGARFHVPSYGLYENWRGQRAITRCSEPRCILNKIAADKLAEIGITPAWAKRQKVTP